MRSQGSDGTVRTNAYDDAGRPIARTNETTGASIRMVYAPSGTLVASFSKKNAHAKEIGFYTIHDGMKRMRARAKDPVSFKSGYKGIIITRDSMGRAVSRTGPTKMTPDRVVAGPDDATVGGYTHRPLGFITSSPKTLGTTLLLLQWGGIY